MEYVQAFKNEIATENLVTDIGKRIMSVFKFIGELIKKAISIWSWSRSYAKESTKSGVC